MSIRTPPPSIWFVARITEALGGGEYLFREITYAAGSWQTKDGGRFGETGRPGVALDGTTFSAGDHALCRLAEDGSRYQLLPLAPGTAGNCTGCGWVGALKQEHCLKVSVISAEGDCACGSGALPIYLSSEDGEVWGYPGGAGGGGGGGGGGGTVTSVGLSMPRRL